MPKLRWWLALSAAAAVPLMLYMTRRQQRRGRLDVLRDAVTDRIETTADAARSALGSLGETTRGAADTVAATAARAAERAGAVLAAAPVAVPWSHRDGDDNPAAGDGQEDWRRYPERIGHR
jgi:hypothetical protein